MRSTYFWVVAGPAVGAVLGLLVVGTYPDRDAPLWTVWAPIALCLSVVSGLAISYGLRRWTELMAIQHLQLRPAALPVVGAAVLAVGLTNFTWVLGGDAHANLRNAVLGNFAMVAAIPLATVINGIRIAAGEEQPHLSNGQRLLRLLTFRDLLQRLLAVGGAIFGLTTLQTGSLLSLEHSLNTEFGERPPQYVLIYGAFGSLLILAIYVPGWKSLQRYRARLADGLFPMTDLKDGAEVLEAASSRHKLQDIVGLSSNVFTDMQSGVVTLAPLLAGIAATFLPH
jgi:hypothetical protein